MHIQSRKKQRGFSLVEILVGAAIGLIGMVVIFQVLAVSESRKRTTAAGSDTQINGAIALYALERDLRLAGYGFSTAPTLELGCSVSAFTTTRGAFSFPLLPVQIVQGAAGAPDSLNVLWGNSSLFVNVQTFSASTGTTKTTQSRAGLQPGDLVVVTGTIGATMTCALQEITDDGTNTVTITHAAGAAYTNAAGTPVPAATHNPATPPAFVNGKIYNLGPSPRRNIWSVSGTSLTFHDDITNGAAVSAADSIIDFQAEYGIDVDGNGLISATEWRTVDPSAADWPKVRAIRVALLSRSGQYEKDPVTTTAPTWIGNSMPTGAANNSFVMRNVDGTADSNPAGPNNWRNYRYRVHEAVIPLRNVIWGTAP